MAGSEAAHRPTPGWQAGWWRAADARPSPNCGPRPQGERPYLAVIHSISLPPGEYGGGAVEQLFLNRLDPDAHPAFEGLRGLQVSAHFFLRRDGSLIQFVSADERAWHAGVSAFEGRERCNDFSVGIELEGLEGEGFDARQYPMLAALLSALRGQYPLRAVVGHEHIAPQRKKDPGPGFDWPRLASLLAWPAEAFPFGLPPPVIPHVGD